MKSEYDAALMKNAHGMPNAATAAAASAGPSARAMLNVIELSAIADAEVARARTSEVTSACCAGAENALTTPISSANTITSGAPTRSASASAPSVALSTHRDALRHEQQPPPVEPVGGAARPRRQHEHGRNWQKLRTPSRNAEPVSRKTSSDAARFWNQVPLAESALPTKYGPKSRCPMTWNAARGPRQLRRLQLPARHRRSLPACGAAGAAPQTTAALLDREGSVHRSTRGAAQ